MQVQSLNHAQHKLSKSNIQRIHRLITEKNHKSEVPPLFALLDCSADESLFPMIMNSYNEFHCLFMGDIDPQLQAVAPYIIRLNHESRFTYSLIEKSWGKAWGYFFTSSDDIEQLRRHFRKYLLVKTATEKSLLFRFYDPRVMRTFLMSSNEEELKNFFGEIDNFYMENRTGNSLIKYGLENHGLNSETFSLETEVQS